MGVDDELRSRPRMADADVEEGAPLSATAGTAVGSSPARRAAEPAAAAAAVDDVAAVAPAAAEGDFRDAATAVESDLAVRFSAAAVQLNRWWAEHSSELDGAGIDARDTGDVSGAEDAPLSVGGLPAPQHYIYATPVGVERTSCTRWCDHFYTHKHSTRC
jgi:hypothetical protein